MTTFTYAAMEAAAACGRNKGLNAYIGAIYLTSVIINFGAVWGLKQAGIDVMQLGGGGKLAFSGAHIVLAGSLTYVIGREIIKNRDKIEKYMETRGAEGYKNVASACVIICFWAYQAIITYILIHNYTQGAVAAVSGIMILFYLAMMPLSAYAARALKRIGEQWAQLTRGMIMVKSKNKKMEKKKKEEIGKNSENELAAEIIKELVDAD